MAENRCQRDDKRLPLQPKRRPLRCFQDYFERLRQLLGRGGEHAVVARAHDAVFRFETVDHVGLTPTQRVFCHLQCKVEETLRCHSIPRESIDAVNCVVGVQRDDSFKSLSSDLRFK